MVVGTGKIKFRLFETKSLKEKRKIVKSMIQRIKNNFNISIALTDAFMKAYQNGENYDLISPKNKEVVGSLSAKLVFDEIADGAWRTGDPGLIFIDKISV